MELSWRKPVGTCADALPSYIMAGMSIDIQGDESVGDGYRGGMGRRPKPDAGVTISLRLPGSVLRRLDAVSDRTLGKPPRQALIREAIEAFLDAQGVPDEPRAKGPARKR
jgi:hypothetical protein